MPSIKTATLFALAALCLTACGTSHQAKLDLAAQKPAIVDPDDGVFRVAMQQYLTSVHAAPSSQYEYVRQDLDGDGRREAIVMFESPFVSWCNSDGCKMVVFKASDNHFTALSEVAPVRGPLLVSNTRTRGWRDLVVRVSGRDDVVSKDVSLQFDGLTYPSQPASLPPMPALLAMNDINGTQIFP